MAARNQSRRTMMGKFSTLNPIYEDENESRYSQDSSKASKRNVTAKAPQPNLRPLPVPGENTTTILTHKSVLNKPANENTKSSRVRKRETESNYNLRVRNTTEHRKALGDISNNNSGISKQSFKKPIGCANVNEKPRRKQPLQVIEKPKQVTVIAPRKDPVKPVHSKSSKSEEDEKVQQQKLRKSVASESVQNPTSAIVKLNRLHIGQSNDASGFSTHRFDEISAPLPLPYRADFCRIPEYLEDIHDYLLQREKHFAVGNNFLQNSSISPRWRSILVDWLVTVCDLFHTSEETFHTTVHLLDNLLKAEKSLNRSAFQLTGVTCLFIANKYEDKCPRRIQDYQDLADDSYSIDNILEMEEFILKKLDFNVPPPSSLIFFRRGFKIVAHHQPDVYNCKDLFHSGSFILELALVDYAACAYLPSQLGAASLVLSMMITRLDRPIMQMWNNDIQNHMRCTILQLKPALLTLCNITFQSYNSTHLSNVTKKFGEPQYNRVSVAMHMNPNKWYASVKKQLSKV